MGSNASQPRNEAVRNAVHRHEHLSKEGLLERAFTFAFRGLVYAQIWEDPEVDMEALAITPDSHIVTIASGGCNVLSYLTANPAKITAVDLNTGASRVSKIARCSSTLFAASSSRGSMRYSLASRCAAPMNPPSRPRL